MRQGSLSKIKGREGMKTLAFVNQKGGVAKTTSVVNIGAAMARAGKKVLLIDLDPQGNLSQSLGYNEISDNGITITEVLQGEKLDDATRRKLTDFPYKLVPADIQLSGLEVSLVDVSRRDYLLKDAIGGLNEDFDFILLDCPPSLGVLTLMALTAADKVYIPVQTQYLPLKGVAQLADTVSRIKQKQNPNLDIGGLFCTLYRGYNLDNEVAEGLRRAFKGKVLNTRIKLNNKLAEAASYGVDIFEYAPKSTGARQYKELTAEILEREASS